MSDQTSIPDHIQKQLDDIQQVLKEQSEYQKAQHEVQQEILELYKNIKGFLTVMSWFERIGIFIAKAAAATAVIWAAFEYLVKATGKK